MATKKPVEPTLFSDIKQVHENYDPAFAADLELLFLRTNLTHRDLAAFLGVSNMTYCNWRNGRYKGDNNLPKFAVDAYCRLDDQTLADLIEERRYLFWKAK